MRLILIEPSRFLSIFFHNYFCLLYKQFYGEWRGGIFLYSFKWLHAQFSGHYGCTEQDLDSCMALLKWDVLCSETGPSCVGREKYWDLLVVGPSFGVSARTLREQDPSPHILTHTHTTSSLVRKLLGSLIFISGMDQMPDWVSSI